MPNLKPGHDLANELSREAPVAPVGGWFRTQQANGLGGEHTSRQIPDGMPLADQLPVARGVDVEVVVRAASRQDLLVRREIPPVLVLDADETQKERQVRGLGVAGQLARVVQAHVRKECPVAGQKQGEELLRRLFVKPMVYRVFMVLCSLLIP